MHKGDPDGDLVPLVDNVVALARKDPLRRPLAITAWPGDAGLTQVEPESISLRASRHLRRRLVLALDSTSARGMPPAVALIRGATATVGPIHPAYKLAGRRRVLTFGKWMLVEIYLRPGAGGKFWWPEDKLAW